MEIIKNFGIDPILLGAQVVNFLVVLYLLRRFLYKPVLGMLKKRQDLIKDGIQKTEEANIRLTKVLEEEKQILKNAQAQAKRIIDDAKNQIIKQSAQIEESTKKQTERMLSNAREQIGQEVKEAEKKLTLNIGNLAMKTLEKSLKGIFSEKDQQEVLKKAIQKLKTK